LTPDDRAALNLAYTNAYFLDKNKPINTGAGSTVTFGQYFYRDEIPTVTPFTASLSYDHTFRLPADSTLVVHGATRYMSAHALSNVSLAQINAGAEPYFHVDSQWVGDLSATWSSASKRFSATGYVRNIADNQYKLTANVQTSTTFAARPNEPRTYGAVLNVNF
jgi:hypothetical protein